MSSFTALSAARSEEDVEVVLAVLPALELVEDPVREWPETLGTPEANIINFLRP
jgi:hypothetical protein